ncbi:MAG: DUF4292 domain-containing protein [Chitinophagales bacterium]
MLSIRIKQNLVIAVLLLNIHFSVLGADTMTYFTAKSIIEIDQQGNQETFTAHFRYRVNDTLWISLTGTLGIEGARILVTRDSTFVINKLEKTAFVYSNNEGNEFFPIPLQLSDWSLLLLNQTYPIDSSTLLQTSSEEQSLTYFDPFYTKTLFCNLKKDVLRAELNVNGQKCVLSFEEFKPIKIGMNVAMKRILTLQNGINMWRLKINYHHFEINKVVSLPFNFSTYKNESP